MKKMAVDNRIKPHRPIIMELIGPAGAGKTTLSRALSQRDEDIVIGPDIELRKVSHIPVFIRSISSSASLFLYQRKSNRQPTWTELKDIAYLKGWPQFLRRRPSNTGKVILLDQGPVFRMATLHEFGPESLRSEASKTWWLHLYEQWASTLDILIWLDTSDAVLMERINTRTKKHDIKGRPELEAQQFLTQYRRSFNAVLTKLKSYNGPTILQFDTSKISIEQIADEILAACKLKLNEN
jgi:thymidylate kinase